MEDDRLAVSSLRVTAARARRSRRTANGTGNVVASPASSIRKESLMRHSRVYLLAAVVMVLSVPAAILLASAMPAQKHRSAEGVVTAWLQALNAGMQTGDFTALGELYAEDATFTLSNPTGSTSVYRGRDQIVDFFEGFQRGEPELRFTQESMASIAREVVVAYENASSPALAAPARCFHVFQVRKGLVQDEHWSVFFGGTEK
jgi:hypothetical protein